MIYKQLSFEQRIEIRALLKIGCFQSQIANQLGVHKSTISREIKRNSGLRGYRPKQAQVLTDHKRGHARKHIRFTDRVKQRAIHYLNHDWSPEQISGYLLRNEDILISHETIYQFIWSDKQSGGELYKHLRHSCKKRKKRYGKQDYRGQIKNRISIDERPKVVDKKERIGDWEIDTIIGKNHKGVLISAVERKTQFSCIRFVPKKKAQLVAKTIIDMLNPYKNKILTITLDNGKEFANHIMIAEQLKADVYFAHPYCAYQRGLNEQVNGLIRQYFPKKSDFNHISKNDTRFVENRLNNRPRKLLDFKKPRDEFINNKVALGT